MPSAAAPPPEGPGHQASYEREESNLRLAEHLRSLGRMYPVLAHDLHAYLNTMVLNAELIQRGVDACHESPTPERLEKIRRSAALIATELAALDRMMRAVVGQTRLSEELAGRFDLRALINDLAIVIGCFTRHRRARMSLDLADIPLAVLGDGDAVKHALLAYLMTAVDEAADGGDLHLSLRADRSRAAIVVEAGGPRGAVEPRAASAHEEPSTDSIATHGVARAALTRHGARVREARDAQGRLSFEIELPLASPHA